MQTTKMSLANIQGKLSRTEMKNIMAGVGDETIGGQDCLTEFSYDCGYAPSLGCCSPNRCEANATNSGTICVAPR